MCLLEAELELTEVNRPMLVVVPFCRLILSHSPSFYVCGSQLLLCGSKIERERKNSIKITINVQFMLYKLQAVAFVSTGGPYMEASRDLYLLMSEKVMIVWHCSEEFFDFYKFFKYFF